MVQLLNTLTSDFIKTPASDSRNSEFLKTWTDEELWFSTIKEAEAERNSTLKVISYLQEINLRRLHLKRGYSSLHEYCVSVLKYSDGGAYRRIKAMRLLENLPETKKSIETGSLNLTTASQLQRVIETQEKSHQPLAQSKKLDLFRRVDGKSKREAEKTLAHVCPEIITQTETQRYIAQDKIKRTLVISEDLNEKIEKLKRLRSHENKDFLQILEDLVDRELKRVDHIARASRLSTKSGSVAHPTAHTTRKKKTFVAQTTAIKKAASPEKFQTEIETATKTPNQAIYSRYIPAAIKREVWKRSNGQCSYVDPITKKKCLSTHWLQIDHIVPFAKRGPTVLENLRLLCGSHNKLEAIKHFGERKLYQKSNSHNSSSLE